jgi:hypothetical protein
MKQDAEKITLINESTNLLWSRKESYADGWTKTLWGQNESNVV